jgi:hypothetical protein
MLRGRNDNCAVMSIIPLSIKHQGLEVNMVLDADQVLQEATMVTVVFPRHHCWPVWLTSGLTMKRLLYRSSNLLLDSFSSSEHSSTLNKLTVAA